MRRAEDNIFVTKPAKAKDGRWEVVVRFDLKRDAVEFTRHLTSVPPPGRRGGTWAE